VERSNQIPKSRIDLRDQDVGETGLGHLGGIRRRDLCGERGLIKQFDDGAEQRFLGLEMVIERLPRQPRGLGHLLDRRAAETVPAEHAQRRVENAVLRLRLTLGLHLTNLTNRDEMSNQSDQRMRECAGMTPRTAPGLKRKLSCPRMRASGIPETIAGDETLRRTGSSAFADDDNSTTFARRDRQLCFTRYAARNIRVALSITSLMRSGEGGGAAWKMNGRNSEAWHIS